MNEKVKVLALGLLFVVCLMLAYVENLFFFQSLGDFFAQPWTAVLAVFSHNVLAISLIMLGMSFYVRFVLNFLPKRRYEYLVLEHPRLFASVFTIMILAVSVLRANTLLGGELLSNAVFVMLLSLPQGILEAYAIFLTIEKILEKRMTRRTLATVYILFFLAALLEVGFVQLLRTMPR
ncbi:MAG: hypothetical protein ACE5IF_01255 [Candidatus Bathyarchaeia archaeon]